MTSEEMYAAYKAESKAAAEECNAAKNVRERELEALRKAMPNPAWGQGPGGEGDRYIEAQARIEARYNAKEQNADAISAARAITAWYKYMPGVPEAFKEAYFKRHQHQQAKQPTLWEV